MRNARPVHARHRLARWTRRSSDDDTTAAHSPGQHRGAASGSRIGSVVLAMRFIEPVKPSDANGLVAEIYGDVRRDFALLRDPRGNSPFLAHSPHPELLAAFWSMFYETVLVERNVRRADKE